MNLYLSVKLSFRFINRKLKHQLVEVHDDRFFNASLKRKPHHFLSTLFNLILHRYRSKRQTVSGSPVVIDGCKEKLLALITNQDTSKLSNMPRVDGVAQILHEVLQAMSQIVYSDSYKLNTGTYRITDIYSVFI